MRDKNSWTLAAVIALMLLAVWAFSKESGVKAVYQPRAGTLGGVVRVDGRALIDINTADEALLVELPGIGEALALRIVREREQGGAFESVDGLVRVSGIAEGKLQAIRPRVTACPP